MLPTRLRLWLMALSLSAATALAAQSSACGGVTAAPYPVEYRQPDGTTLMVQGRGSGYLHYMQTTDQYTLIATPDGYLEYAVQGPDGRLMSTGRKANDPPNRTLDEQIFLSDVRPNTFDSRAVREQKRLEKMEAHIQRADFPTTGTRKVILILIQYPDLLATNTVDEFDDLMNEPNYNGTGSFRDFFQTSSFNQLTLNTDVYGWYTAANNADYYKEDNGRARARELGREAVDAAEAAGVDFSQYDNDGNGAVDGVIFVHSGPGAEEGSMSDLYVWSHRSRLSNSSQEVTYDGVLIDDYMMNPERRNNNSRMVGIGIFAHEFGHGLGLPDLYDTDDSNGDSEGIGWWGLMGSGNWAGSEDTPTNFGAWSRIELGWQTSTNITGQQDGFELRPASEFNNEVYRLNTGNANEYFLLENRQNVGIDVSVPGHGMIIWHIDDNLSTNSDETHKWVDVEEADALNDLDNNVNRGDDGDPFPGTSVNRVFNDSSNPNSKRYDGTNTDTDINNIREEGTLVKFNMLCEPANAVCTAFINLYLDQDGEATITELDVDNGSTFDCGFHDRSISRSLFTCSNLGYNSVTLTVEDDNGNTDECTTNVYVYDELPPILTLPANVLVDCWYSPTDPGATGYASATDNCDNVIEITYEDVEFVFENGARQITRTWTAVDDEGNSISGDQIITVPPPITLDAGEDQTVYVNFIGIPGYPYSACAGLSASAFGGTPPYTYAWSDGQTGQSVEVCPDVCTQYTVTITDSKGCEQVDNLIVYAIIVECMMGNNEPVKYLLCHNDETICTSFSSTEVHLSHGDGLGACGDIGDQGCEDILPFQGVRFEGDIAARPSRDTELDVFPNPARDVVDIQLYAPDTDRISIRLYDAQGRQVAGIREWHVVRGHQLHSLAVDQLPAGTYIVRATGDSGFHQVRSLVVMK